MRIIVVVNPSTISYIAIIVGCFVLPFVQFLTTSVGVFTLIYYDYTC